MVDEYNENLRDLFTDFWPYKEQKIEFKDGDEVLELYKSHSKDYAVLATLQLNNPNSFYSTPLS